MRVAHLVVLLLETVLKGLVLDWLGVAFSLSSTLDWAGRCCRLIWLRRTYQELFVLSLLMLLLDGLWVYELGLRLALCHVWRSFILQVIVVQLIPIPVVSILNILLIIHLGRWSVWVDTIPAQSRLLRYGVVAGFDQLTYAIVHPILVLVLSESILQYVTIFALHLLHLLLICIVYVHRI
jgi:hypothetical protein